jgi:hypothetical protein
MKKITDNWVERYLQVMRSGYYNLTDDRQLTISQKDKIKKTLKAFNDNFKAKTKEDEKE